MLVVSSVAVSSPAYAVPMVEKEESGVCSAGTRWELDIERERQAVYIDFSIERAPARERWTVRIAKNGSSILTTSVVTDRDGEADVSRRIRDTSAPDTFSVRATSELGEVCRASMRI